MKMILLLSLLGAFSANASIVAIIDSGTDTMHSELQNNIWKNAVDLPNNQRDEDHNTYVDDFYGWNFAEGNNKVIDYKYLDLLNEDIKKFFDIQAKNFYGTATAEEIRWARYKMGDEEFIKRISTYANFMHGTHVAGISVKKTQAKALSVKLIPTEVGAPGSSTNTEVGAPGSSTNTEETAFELILNDSVNRMINENGNKDLGMMLAKLALSELAKQQMKMLATIGEYVNGHKADVANGSFGTGYPQSEQICKAILQMLLRREPDADEVKEAATHFLNALVKEGKAFTDAAPKTLFVFAAGNDGLNNDEYPTSPTNIKSDNTISVSALLGIDAIAVFSNFGSKMVEVAAPGVGIISTVPGNEHLSVSGTSQAAPYVTNCAAQIKDANAGLSPLEIKKIIMGTVDYKEFLKGKVQTGGVVNTARAVRASELSKTMKLDEAIASARVNVADMTSSTNKMIHGPQGDKSLVLPLPSMFHLNF
jgi:subtilisin family serine protease